MLHRLLGKPRCFALPGNPIKTGCIWHNLLSEGTAQQLTDRLHVILTGEIPQGYIDSADTRHHTALATIITCLVIHFVPEHINIKRIAI